MTYTKNILINRLTSYKNFYNSAKLHKKIRKPNFPEDISENLVKFTISENCAWKEKPGDLYSEVLGKIMEARAEKIDGYTLEASIADALTYHGACSMISGLEQADGAVTKLTTSVGIDALYANPAYKDKVLGDDKEKSDKGQ
jgi:hypothetical protein